MTTFDETAVRRDGSGQFAEKPAAPEGSAELDGADFAAERERADAVAMVRLGAIVNHHHGSAETVLVSTSGYAFEDGSGNEVALAPLCRAQVARATASLDRTDPDRWEYFAEGYTEEAETFEYPDGIALDDDGTMSGARLPLSYLAGGRSDEVHYDVEACANCHGTGGSCGQCIGSGVSPVWDPERRELGPEVDLNALASPGFARAWSEEVDTYGRPVDGPGPERPAIRSLQMDSPRQVVDVDGEAVRSDLVEPVTFAQMTVPGTRSIAHRVELHIQGRSLRVYAARD